MKTDLCWNKIKILQLIKNNKSCNLGSYQLLMGFAYIAHFYLFISLDLLSSVCLEHWYIDRFDLFSIVILNLFHLLIARILISHTLNKHGSIY